MFPRDKHKQWRFFYIYSCHSRNQKKRAEPKCNGRAEGKDIPGSAVLWSCLNEIGPSKDTVLIGWHLELQFQFTGSLAWAMEIPASGTLGLFSVSLGSVPRSLCLLFLFHFELLVTEHLLWIFTFSLLWLFSGWITLLVNSFSGPTPYWIPTRGLRSASHFLCVSIMHSL